MVASQWLHVKPPHMLLNVLVIGGVGLAAEARLGRLTPALVALAGGTLGQWIAVVTQPEAFISGASQAYLAICGLAVAVGGVSRWGRILAWAAIVVALLLDIVVSGHGTVKPGHLCGLAVGILAGLILRVTGARRSA
nr:rhomboid family intramembrane serine protease [Caulobacter hibisci]